jgi:hypothetical protein
MPRIASLAGRRPRAVLVGRNRERGAFRREMIASDGEKVALHSRKVALHCELVG